MPKKAASTSSSSSEEDLSKFRSIAVSFEEITSKQKEVAEQAKKRISGGRKPKKPLGKHAGADGGDAGPLEQDSDGDGNDGPLDQLDPFQLKVAAALDSLLEGRMRHKEPGPKRRRREARAAERAEKEAASAGGFQFFARVPPGTDVVLDPPEEPAPQGTPFPETFRQRRTPPADEALAALPTLAVDGAAIIAVAAAKALAARGEGGGPTTPGQKGAAGQTGRAGKYTPAKKSQRNLGEGVVLESPPFVPHDERIRRLVGCA